jgi:hypothetical protein
LDCKSIESLLRTIVDLKHLIKLRLQGCENLKELPQTIGNMSLFSKLDLYGCKSIESLLTTIVDLKHLIKLRLQGCEDLKEFLQSIGSTLDSE